MAVLVLADLCMSTALLPLDTPEVAAAKAEHFARYNYEAARNTLGLVPANFYLDVPYFYTSPIYYGLPSSPLIAPEIVIQARSLDTVGVETDKTTTVFADNAKTLPHQPSDTPAKSSDIPIPASGQQIRDSTLNQAQTAQNTEQSKNKQ
ncbi:hypothetical protein QAD02_023479 [Eretmocerus hayati]|uniref:Uncharacterized protein n=1 Tax=Eretmocerus hayati TaxID=131215 RepID=A0ACC2PVS1_9HYME|nr:hypothetical protein QAD02_023479 [Eretmocerus hayati]